MRHSIKLTTLLLFTFFVGVYCGGRADKAKTDSGIVGTGEVSSAPQVNTITPANNATGVYTDATIKITFNTQVDVSSVTLTTNTTCTGSIQVATDSSFSTCVPMDQSVQQSGTQITVRAASLWTVSAQYYIRITTAVKNTGGTQMAAQYSSTFTTGTTFSPLSGEFGSDCSSGINTMADVRSAANGAPGLNLSVPNLTVTAIDKDSYFYVQASGATGPAVLIRDTAHKASALGLQVGDVVCLTVDERDDYNNLQQVKTITAIKKTNAGSTLAAQTISGVVNNDDYEAELVKVAGTLTTKSTTLAGGGYNHVITYGGNTLTIREMDGSGKLTNFVQGQDIEVTTVVSQYSTDYQLYVDSSVGTVKEWTGGTFNVSGASSTSTTEVKLTFNNLPDAAAQTAGNYTADNGLTISAVSVSGVTATLTTSAQTTGTTYTVTVTNVKRQADNAALTTNNAAFTGFLPPASFTTGQVVINEVHAAPSGASAEFIELYNTTASAISLKNATLWYKAAGSAPSQSVTLSGSIPANGNYTVLASSIACGGTTQVGLGTITGLSNSAAGVVLTVDGTKPTATTDTNIRDVAQWGTNSINWGEGGTTGPAPSSNKSVSRAPNGVDTNNTSNDFILSSAADGTCGANNWAGDVTAPTVSSTVPANAATGVAVSSTLSVTFSESMQVSSVSTTNFYLVQGASCAATPITGTITPSTLNTVFSFPSGTLSASTQYSLCIKTGVKDVALISLASDVVSTFTTAAPDITPPTVASANPANGATGVALSPSVSVTFDEAMDVATVNSAFTVKATNCSGATVSAGTPTASNGNKTFTYALSGLTASTGYASCVTTGAKDVAGNALGSAYSATWTTGTGGGETLIYSENFENCSKTGGYAAANTTGCTGGQQWNLDDATMGNLANDAKNGTKSIRARNSGTSLMTVDVAGAKRVKFYYGKYGTDANTTLQLQSSTDGGSTWVNQGSAITVSSATLTQADIVVSFGSSVRFHILKTDGTTARANIDDFEIYN